MADYTTPPPTALDKDAEALLPALRSAELAVLCGRKTRASLFFSAASSKS
jgi:hypothetical protein